MDRLNSIFTWCRERLEFAGEVVTQVDRKQPNIKYSLGLLVVYLILLWGVVPKEISQFLLMCYGAWCVGQRLDEAGRVLRIKTSYGGGQVDNTCEFRIVGREDIAPAAPVQAKPAATSSRVMATRVVNGEKKVTNAQRYRDRIALAKERGEDMSVVIQFGIDVLGQTRQLSTAYFKANWNKV